MPSPARVKFTDAISRAELLCLKGRAALFSRKQRQVQYHASLAASVAAWEAYIESVVRAFFAEIADPLQPKFTALHQIAISRAEADLKKFNTPNAKNSRELLFQWTGFDPINDWNWPARRLSGPRLGSDWMRFCKCGTASPTGIPRDNIRGTVTRRARQI